MSYDLVIRNGTLIEGRGTPRFKTEIGPEVTYIDGECTRKTPGKLLRHGHAQII